MTERASRSQGQSQSPGPRPSPRALGLACAGLALSAVLLWAGSATVWYRVPSAGADPPGAAPVELTGAQVAPWLGGTALLALAGVAGVVAAGGVLRRLVGVLLGLTGIGVAAFGLRALFSDAYAAGAAEIATGASVPPPSVTGAPLLAVAGALALLAVGIVVLVRERRLPRLGARYAAPGERRVERDPDRAAWKELDEGRDPTADPPAERAADRAGDPAADPPGAPPGGAGDDPGDGPRSAAV